MTAQVSGGIEYTGGPKFNIDDDFRASSKAATQPWVLRAPPNRHKAWG